MYVILAFYAIAILIIVAAAVGVYRLLAPRNRILAAGLALLILSGLVLLWPIPIHGGFLFLGEALHQELEEALEKWDRKTERQRKQKVMEQVENRFTGTLHFTVTEPLSDNWQRVVVDGALPAWYETDSHMLWSEWLHMEAGTSLPSLAEAKDRCRRHPPTGYWALISETENYLLWKSGGRKLLPPSPASSISQLFDIQLGMEMATYALEGSATNDSGQQNAPRSFVVRCVARGPQAPATGYLRGDIPLEEWNRYQLLKGLN